MAGAVLALTRADEMEQAILILSERNKLLIAERARFDRSCYPVIVAEYDAQIKAITSAIELLKQFVKA